jgi:hypothetical protein
MIILWLVSVWLLAKFLPLPKMLSGNVVFRFLASIALSLILFSALGLVFYFVNITTSPLVYLLILLAGSILATVKFPANSLKPSRQDLILLIPALLVVLFFGVNIFLDGYGKRNVSQTAVLQSISKAEDDAGNHLMLFGRFYMNDNSTLTYDSYTAGYEWSTALLANSIVPSWLNPPAIYMVDFYVMAKLITFGGLVLMLTILLYELYKKYIHKKLTRKHHFLLGALSLIFGLFIFAPLYRNGFYSFMPVLIYILMIITLLSSTTDAKSRKIALPMILMLTIGISTSWFMAVPVGLLTTGLLRFARNDKGNARFDITTISLFIVNIIILTLLLIMLFSAGTVGSAGEALGLSGGYPTLSRFFVVAIAVLAAGFVFKNRPSVKKFANLESLYIFLAIGFALLLFIYFQLTSGALTYYYLKIETSVIVALLPFAIIFVLYILKKYNFWWQFSILPIFASLYLISQLVSPNDYVQYITDWDNKAATLEVNAAAPIVKKLSKPIYDPAQNVCTIIVNKVYIETVNADHLANNPTNRNAENHCLPDDYLAMHNAGELNFQTFEMFAKRYNVKYQIYTSEIGGGPSIINVRETQHANVEILSY